MRKLDPNTCGSKTRFPENRYPGKFDLCGAHSIFHILVVQYCMPRCGPVDMVPRYLRSCSRKSYLLVFLSYLYMPNKELLYTGAGFQQLNVR